MGSVLHENPYTLKFMHMSKRDFKGVNTYTNGLKLVSILKVKKLILLKRRRLELKRRALKSGVWSSMWVVMKQQSHREG